MDGFLVQYAYPSSLINEHLSKVLNGDSVTNLKAMVMMWINDHLVQGGWAKEVAITQVIDGTIMHQDGEVYQ